jgi:hypothetical protein
MATSILLDEEIEEYGYDDTYLTKVFVSYASASDIIEIRANNDKILMGVNEAAKIAVALAKFVKFYGSRDTEHELKEILNAP